MDERKKLERELAEAKKALALGGGASAGDSDIQTVNGMKFDEARSGRHGLEDMKSLVDESKAKLGSGVVAFVSTNGEGRASLYVGVTADSRQR